MKQILLSVITLFFFSLISCGEAAEKKSEADSLNADSLKHADQTTLIKNYYRWFNDNAEELDQFKLIKNYENNGDSTLTFSIDFPATERWLNKFESSGFVSENFITHWRNYFKECEEALQAEKSWDGAITGFDYRFIYGSQDDDLTNELLEQCKFISSTTEGNHEVVTIGAPGMYSPLVTHLEKTADGKWKVAQ